MAKGYSVGRGLGSSGRSGKALKSNSGIISGRGTAKAVPIVPRAKTVQAKGLGGMTKAQRAGNTGFGLLSNRQTKASPLVGDVSPKGRTKDQFKYPR